MRPARSEVKAYALANVFALWLGAALIVGGIVFLAIPKIRNGSSVTQTVGWLDWAWSMSYLVAGVFVVWGILSISLRLEVAGKTLLATTIAIQATATLHYRGSIAVPGALISYGLAAACLIRVYVLVHARNVALAERRDDGSARARR